MGISWINNYIRTRLKDFRAVTRQDGVAIWSYTTGAGGFESWDAYNRVEPQWVKTSNIISGAVAWGKTYDRMSSEGGYYDRADLTIVASLDHKSYFTGSGFSTETKLEYGGKKFKVMSLVEANDTNEIVVYCEKLS